MLVIAGALHDLDLALNPSSQPGWFSHNDTHRLVGGKKILNDLRSDLSCWSSDGNHGALSLGEVNSTVPFTCRLYRTVYFLSKREV
jgi:hypothetical protein